MGNTWIIHYEIAAIIMILVIMIIYAVGERISTTESKIFVRIMIASLAASVLDELSIQSLMGYLHFPKVVNYILLILYNIFLIILVYLYAIYIVNLTKSYVMHIKRKRYILLLPVIVETLLLVTTPFTKFIFYIDEAGDYQRGFGMPLYLLIFSGYVIYIAYLCITRNRYLNRLQHYSIIIYTAIALTCSLIQVLVPRLLLTCFGVAIGVVIIYFSIQGGFVDTDRMLGTFSMDAFYKKVQSSIDAGKKFNVITIRVGGFDELNVVHGNEAANDILSQIAEYLMKLIPGHLVFHLNGYFFSCYVEGEDALAFDYALRIQNRFLQKFRSSKMQNEANILFKISIISVPRITDSIETMTAINSSIINTLNANDNQYIVVVDDKAVEEYRYRCAVEEAIERAVKNGDFEVYYQPVINIETGKVHGAEALLRLKDEELGEIPPEYFIPIAEENGSIVQLTSMVIHRVCRFIIDNRLETSGVKHVGINMSSVECRQSGMADRIIAIVNGYGIPYDMFRFEIKEGTSRGQLGIVRDNVDKLVDNGMQLVLDSFGVGYSNIGQLVNLPVDMIKIDRNLLWLAADDDDAMAVLRALVDMMHSIDRTVLICGVEEEAHEEIIKELDIKLVQGYYYSMAVDAATFMEYSRNVNEYGMSPAAE